jgi:hypothetical protein
LKRVVVSTAVLALGIGGVGLAQAQAPSGFKVNGGGQVILDENAQGPGDTVAFTAQQLEGNEAEGTPARGQFQYVERSGENGNVHGTVTCLRVEGNRAIIEGVVTRGEAGPTFRIDLADAGRGAQGEDVVTVTFPDEASECEDDIAEDDDFRLARGNVTVHEPRG